MTFDELLTAVYENVQENKAAPIRWKNDRVAFYANKAFRRIVGTVGRYEIRTTLNLVQGQQVYQLPDDVKRLKAVWVVPENSTTTVLTPLEEVGFEFLPVLTGEERDPTNYALRASDLTNPDQMAVVLFPIPGRNGTDDLVIDYERDVPIVSDEVATAPQLAAVLPIKEQFDLALTYFTSAFLLKISDDQDELTKAAIFENEGEDILKREYAIGSVTRQASNSRNYYP